MNNQRRNSVKVADVVIPQRLLSISQAGRDFRRQSTVLLEEGPVQDAIRQTQRNATLASIGEHPALAGAAERKASLAAERKASLAPTTTQDAATKRFSAITFADRPKSTNVNENSLFHSLKEFQFSEQDPNVRKVGSTSSASTSSSSEDEGPARITQRRGTVMTIVHAVVPDSVQETARNVRERVRRGTIFDIYEKAKVRGAELERKKWVMILFEYSVYLFLLSIIYFVFIGLPLWKGAVWWLYWVAANKFVITGGWTITMGIALFYAFSPLFILFEKEPPVIERPDDFDRMEIPGVANTALLIPCYKSARIIGPTLQAALKIFPPSHIFVLANGNSETPLDETEEVCRPYGVNHIWSPVGSKIVAQFVGCYAAKGFKNVLLIDDDCALPPNFPVVSDRLTETVQSIGYTIKSVGPNSSKGTYCQQAQDLEYKISGLQRAFAGKIGSATFPHGAISLWNRKFLIKTFHDHPGFSVSEDWFFGHSCRRLGGRIKMCSSVFVETETPDAVLWSSGDSRGGFGEMTVFKQRFMRWNFFFVNGMWYNMAYILGSWKLGWWEFGAKIFVFQEVYETLLYLFTPFILPILFIVNPAFCGYLLIATVVMYLINVIIFNEVHLRLRNERVSWTVLLIYYMPYKLLLTAINVGSCYWAIYKYAQYFAKRHPKVIEDEEAVSVVMRLEEEVSEDTVVSTDFHDDHENAGETGRRMYVSAVATRPVIADHPGSVLPMAEPVKYANLAGKRMSFAPVHYNRHSLPPLPESGVSAQDFAGAQSSEKAENKRSSYQPAVQQSTGKRNSWAQSPV